MTKNKRFAIFILLLAGTLIWIAASIFRHQPITPYQLITVVRADTETGTWSLNAVTLPTRQSVVLHVFAVETQPLFVTYAPPEHCIGVLLSRNGNLEFNLLNRFGKMIKQIPIPINADSITRPYYRNGQFLFSTPDALLSITARNGMYSKIDIKGKIPPLIHEVLEYNLRAIVPNNDSSHYSFCYGPEVRTHHIGTRISRGFNVFPPITGHVYTLSVSQGKLSQTSINAIDLIPSHQSQVALYTRRSQSGYQIKIMTQNYVFANEFMVSQPYSSLRWSPSDMQMYGWDQKTLACYHVPTGKILFRMPLEFPVEDWDCIRDW